MGKIPKLHYHHTHIVRDHSLPLPPSFYRQSTRKEKCIKHIMSIKWGKPAAFSRTDQMRDTIPIDCENKAGTYNTGDNAITRIRHTHTYAYVGVMQATWANREEAIISNPPNR